MIKHNGHLRRRGKWQKKNVHRTNSSKVYTTKGHRCSKSSIVYNKTRLKTQITYFIEELSSEKLNFMLKSCFWFVHLPVTFFWFSSLSPSVSGRVLYFAIENSNLKSLLFFNGSIACNRKNLTKRHLLYSFSMKGQTQVLWLYLWWPRFSKPIRWLWKFEN